MEEEKSDFWKCKDCREEKKNIFPLKKKRKNAPKNYFGGGENEITRDNGIDKNIQCIHFLMKIFFDS